MDDADRADDRIEQATQAGNEYVRGNELFCCRECAEDYERFRNR
jgi:hypothetical protein